VRRLVAQTRLHPADLVLPVFVREGIDEPTPIEAMPGVVQHTLESLVAEAHRCVEAGLGGIMLFGVPESKDAIGSGADADDGILNVGLRALVDAVGDDLVVMSDLCLDEFTDHGHCGVLDSQGRVDNDATLERYASMALAQARTGAHVLGLSGMMDGQVGHVREALDAAGFTDTILLAYAAKYTSALYGPFREAVQSSLQGDRAAYQQDPSNAHEAAREIELDLAEGADFVMVKPGLPYLDVLARVKDAFGVPTFVYQVSGEYAMIEHAAAAGAGDRDALILETLLAFKRAGAAGILTYHAVDAARLIHG
jgi:porphobilinogen synthase